MFSRRLYFGASARHMPQFVCNICKTCNEYLSWLDIDREWPSCTGCGSSARVRWIVRALLVQFPGRSSPIGDAEPTKNIKGLGLSDWPALAGVLEASFNYSNTFYDAPPQFDIRKDVAEDMKGRFDFVIASEVFEHVAPPIQDAFNNLASLLKPGGIAIFSVPWFGEETLEYFPSLHEWRIVEEAGRAVLLNLRTDGELERFENVCFHGGPGSTLEMRLFGRKSLERNFRQAGFDSVSFAQESIDYGNGIVFHRPFSLPCIALRRRRTSNFLQLFRNRTPVATAAVTETDGVLLMNGWHAVEQGRSRWTCPNFSFAVRAKEGNRGTLVMALWVPEKATDTKSTHSLRMQITNTPIILEQVLKPGPQTVEFQLPGPAPTGVWTMAQCSVNPAIRAAEDARELGVSVSFLDDAGTYQSPFWIE